jgi:lysophospholipase L1-like esterase
MKTCFQFLVPTVLVVFIFVLDATARLIVYPVGDSITWGTTAAGGYRSPLYQKLTAAGYNVDMVGSKKDFADSVLIAAGEQHHDGHSGWRILQIDQQIEGWLQLFEAPDVILIHIGTNDFGNGASNRNAIQQLDNLMTKIALATPASHLIVTNLLERGGSANTNIQADFNPFVEAKIARQVALGRKVSFLDMRAAVPLSDMPDRLHPNRAGLTKMADAYYKAILKVIDPFEITSFHLEDVGEMKQASMTWSSKTDRSYVIQISPDASTWSDLPFSFPSGGRTTSRTISIPEGIRFFRIREGLPTADFLAETNVKWLVPSDGSLEMRWSALTLPEDAGFIDGEGLAAGFEIRAGPFDPLISTNVIDTMLSTNTSIYLRYHFEVPAGPQFKTLTLGMRYDDGYVAYLNGTEIVRRNAPSVVGWDAIATKSHPDLEAVEFENIDLSEFLGLLQLGENVLAIHGMNRTKGGSDLLIEPLLTSDFEQAP